MCCRAPGLGVRSCVLQGSRSWGEELCVAGLQVRSLG